MMCILKIYKVYRTLINRVKSTTNTLRLKELNKLSVSYLSIKTHKRNLSPLMLSVS